VKRIQWHYSKAWFLLIVAAVMAGLLVACGDDQDDTGNEPQGTQQQRELEIAEDAPDPIDVSASDLDLIDEWQEVGVPRFRDGATLEFEPHPSQIPNAGTLLLDGQGAAPEEVIAFYRGALRVLGWEERRVSNREMTARKERASLLVVVTNDNDRTVIMMMITDAPDRG
jgi:hypothetical protein